MLSIPSGALIIVQKSAPDIFFFVMIRHNLNGTQRYAPTQTHQRHHGSQTSDENPPTSRVWIPYLGNLMDQNNIKWTTEDSTDTVRILWPYTQFTVTEMPSHNFSQIPTRSSWIKQRLKREKSGAGGKEVLCRRPPKKEGKMLIWAKKKKKRPLQCTSDLTPPASLSKLLPSFSSAEFHKIASL